LEESWSNLRIQFVLVQGVSGSRGQRATLRGEGALGRLPGKECASLQRSVIWGGKHRRIDMQRGSWLCVETDETTRPRAVCGGDTLVETQIRAGISEHYNGHMSRLKFLPKSARQGKRDPCLGRN